MAPPATPRTPRGTAAVPKTPGGSTLPATPKAGAPVTPRAVNYDTARHLINELRDNMDRFRRPLTEASRHEKIRKIVFSRNRMPQGLQRETLSANLLLATSENERQAAFTR